MLISGYRCNMGLAVERKLNIDWMKQAIWKANNSEAWNLFQCKRCLGLAALVIVELREDSGGQYARENNTIPWICLGLQVATIEFCRNVWVSRMPSTIRC